MQKNSVVGVTTLIGSTAFPLTIYLRNRFVNTTKLKPLEQDLVEAKKYLSQQGYGSGTNYTTNLVAVLLANYAQAQIKKLSSTKNK